MSRKVLIAIAILLFLQFLDVSSQEMKDKGKMDENIVSKTTQRGSVVLSVFLPEKFIAGSPVLLSTIIDNQGGQSVYFFETNKVVVFEIDVTDAKGVPVPLTRFGEIYASKEAGSEAKRRIRRELGPGKILVESINIGRLFDLSISGSYYISIRRQFNEDTERPIVLEIPKISFQVTEPVK